MPLSCYFCVLCFTVVAKRKHTATPISSAAPVDLQSDVVPATAVSNSEDAHTVASLQESIDRTFAVSCP